MKFYKREEATYFLSFIISIFLNALAIIGRGFKIFDIITPVYIPLSFYIPFFIISVIRSTNSVDRKNPEVIWFRETFKEIPFKPGIALWKNFISIGAVQIVIYSLASIPLLLCLSISTLRSSFLEFLISFIFMHQATFYAYIKSPVLAFLISILSFTVVYCLRTLYIYHNWYRNWKIEPAYTDRHSF